MITDIENRLEEKFNGVCDKISTLGTPDYHELAPNILNQSKEVSTKQIYDYLRIPSIYIRNSLNQVKPDSPILVNIFERQHHLIENGHFYPEVYFRGF